MGQCVVRGGGTKETKERGEMREDKLLEIKFSFGGLVRPEYRGPLAVRISLLRGIFPGRNRGMRTVSDIRCTPPDATKSHLRSTQDTP